MQSRNTARCDATSNLEDLPLHELLPAGVPSDLLQRRPDVVIAESKLIAANAEIGVARADLFPRITLTADFGRESAELSDILESEGRAWIADIDIVQPIFNAGARRAAGESDRSEKTGRSPPRRAITQENNSALGYSSISTIRAIAPLLSPFRPPFLFSI